MKDILKFINEKLRLDKNLKNTPKDPNDPDTWLVGDILAGTAGYSMQLPRFYVITKRTAKTFTVKRIAGTIISGHRNGQWEEMPDKNEIKNPSGPESKARINKWGGLQVDGHHVSLWNGKPLHGDDMD